MTSPIERRLVALDSPAAEQELPVQDYMDQLYEAIIEGLIEEGYGVVASFEEPQTIPNWRGGIPFEMKAGIILGDQAEDFAVILGKADHGLGSSATIEFGPLPISSDALDQSPPVDGLIEMGRSYVPGRGKFAHQPRDGGVYGSFLLHDERDPGSGNVVSHSDGRMPFSSNSLLLNILDFKAKFRSERGQRDKLPAVV